MPQSVGTSPITGYGEFNTLIPLLSETADITTALRLYHFGSATYVANNLANTDPTQLPNPGIAYTLYNLQNQLNTISGSLGIPYGEFTAKGDILTSTGAGSSGTVQPLPLGSQGQVLTVNTGLSTGLQWTTPYSQPTIGSTAIPSATTVTTIAGLTLTNPTVNAGSGVIVLPGSNTPAQTADGSIVWDLDSDLLTVGTGAGRKTMVDTDSTQTLSNKTLSNPTITNNLYLFDANSIIFEGTTPDAFEVTLSVSDPVADVTVTIPARTGTLITDQDTGTVTSNMIANNTIVNADINSAAAIVYSKLSLSNSIVNADIATGAAIAITKLAASTISGVSLGNNLNALTVSTGLQLSSGTTYNGSTALTISIDSTVATLTGTQTLTNKTLTDSTTTFQDNLDNTKKMQFELSGITTATTRTLTVPNVSGTIITSADTGTVTSTMIANDTIVNADINSAAAIAYSKLSLSNSIVNADISTGAAIAISKLAASTISGVSLGNNLNTLTIGTGLTGTSYNGSAAVTIAVNTSTIATVTSVDDNYIMTLMGAIL